MTEARRLAAGSLLALLAAAGVFQSSRAALSHAIYWSAKYGSAARGTTAEVLRRCERAYRIYPHSRYLCEYAAECAYADRSGDNRAWVEDVAQWTRRGLRANPYGRRLNELAARALAVEQPGAAVEFWRKYVEWDFWRPDCHAVMVELQLKAGDIEGALKSMRWLKGSEYEGRAARRIRAAWNREKAGPRVAP